MFRHGSSPRRLPAITSTKREQKLEIRGDALLFPIAITRRFRPLWTVDLLGFGPGRLLGEPGLFPAFFGLGKGALRGGREGRFSLFVSDAVGHPNFHLFQVSANSYIDTGGRCAKRRQPVW